MRRKQTHNRPRHRGSALGRHYYDATKMLDKLRHRTVQAMCAPTFTAEAAITAIMDPEKLAILKAAYALTEKSGYWGMYVIDPRSSVQFNFDSLGIMVPWATCQRIKVAEYAPLMALHSEVLHWYHKFAVAEHVLEVLDSTCTVGAMRHYWPSVMALAPGCPGLEGPLPRRFDEPKEPIAPLLPLIRSAAATITTALLSPDHKPASEYHFTMHFSPSNLTDVEGTPIQITTTQVSFDFG